MIFVLLLLSVFHLCEITENAVYGDLDEYGKNYIGSVADWNSVDNADDDDYDDYKEHGDDDEYGNNYTGSVAGENPIDTVDDDDDADSDGNADAEKCTNLEYHLEVVRECCYCGSSDQVVLRRKCIWWAVNSDGVCERHETTDPNLNSHCANADMKPKLETGGNCSHVKQCEVNKFQSRTSNSFWSGTDAPVYTTGVTEFGETCSFDKPNRLENKHDDDERERGDTDTYDNLHVKCDACMMSSSETFKEIIIKVADSDGWKVDWVKVWTNGGTLGAYTLRGSKWIDNGSRTLIRV